MVSSGIKRDAITLQVFRRRDEGGKKDVYVERKMREKIFHVGLTQLKLFRVGLIKGRKKRRARMMRLAFLKGKEADAFGLFQSP